MTNVYVNSKITFYDLNDDIFIPQFTMGAFFNYWLCIIFQNYDCNFNFIYNSLPFRHDKTD